MAYGKKASEKHIPVKRQLVKTDLAAGGPCKQPDCLACLSNPGEGGGLQRQRAGVLYRGTCKICAALGRSTVYLENVDTMQ